jgi:uncharacterized iron-regulated membrane protein
MKAVRAIIFWLHLGVGCVAGLVILAMSITGVLLAFERQINSWADAPAVLQGHSDAGPQAPLDSLLADLRNNGRGVPSELVLHNSADSPVEARFGREQTLYLNPWTGEIIGQPSDATRAFFSTVERVHRSIGLGMQSGFGRGITGAANLAFLFMLVSGIYLWVPKVLNLTSLKRRLLFRRGLEGRAREWNWHHVIGIWAFIPLFFIVLTGVIMSYPWASNLLYRVTGTQPPANGWRGERGSRAGGQPDRDGEQPAAQFQFRTLDALAQIAKQQIPEWKSITIAVPAGEDRNLEVSIDKSIGGQPEQSSQLVINRQSGHVEAIKRFSDNNAGRKLRAWARFLHTGEEFGVAGELVATIACLGAVMLVWTGLSMALRRLFVVQKLQPGSAGLTTIQTGANAQVGLTRDASLRKLNA